MATRRNGLMRHKQAVRVSPSVLIDHLLVFNFASLDLNQTATTVSQVLLEEREREEAALKVILDKQASVPSWWPTCRAAVGGEVHYERIRRAEKSIAREEWQLIKGKETLAKTKQESAALT